MASDKPQRDRGRPHGLPLPHHRTNGSRIRRFGRLGRERPAHTAATAPQPESLLVARQPRFHPSPRARAPKTRRMHYRCSLPSEYPSLSSPSRDTVRVFGQLHDLLYPLQTSLPWSERIAPPSANFFRTRNPRARERSPGVRLRTVGA